MRHQCEIYEESSWLAKTKGAAVPNEGPLARQFNSLKVGLETLKGGSVVVTIIL